MVKKISLLFLLFVIALTVYPNRTKQNFNRGWMFHLGDILGAQQPAFDDHNWESIGLPHSFSLPYFMSPDFYVGYGWYRKNFTVASVSSDKQCFIEFEGAFQDAEIYVNGSLVGRHQGGYTGFSYNITSYVKTGGNVMAVRINNLWNPRLAPRAGEHVFSGGIYRDVWLVTTNKVHVEWYGTFVTTPQISAQCADVRIQTQVRNEGLNPLPVGLKTELFDPNGIKVATFFDMQILSGGSTGRFDQTGSPLENPQRWQPEQPLLYRAVSSVQVNGKTVDQYETLFGIRSIRWTADQGFFLNEKPIYLKGANVHQDHAGWGDAVTNAGFYRDVKMMKEAGFNFIRGSHYPHDPSFAEACDKLGMLFWSENAFWGIGGSERTPEGYWNSSAYPTVEADRSEFDASVLQQLTEMIRIYRNHPSIIVWSMSNEPFFTAQQTIQPMRELLKKAVSLTHQLDSTRPAAIGGAQRPLDSNRIDLLGDVAGYNGDGASISVLLNPGVPSVVSEYGSTTADRPGNYEPGWGDLGTDKGEPVHPWRSGQAVWCGFDHGSIAGTSLAKMGIVDYFRIPKQAWYWYRTHYTGVAAPECAQPGKPYRLKLEADRSVLQHTDGTEDAQLLVTILDSLGKPISTNAPIELRVVSGPGEFPTGNAIVFGEKSDIRVQDGKAAIEFRSYHAGVSLLRATSPGLGSSELRIISKKSGKETPNNTTQVKNREYIRFSKVGQPNIPQLFGRNNPTFASSSDSAHPAGFAADGNAKSWWQPLAGDTLPTWMLDTEKSIVLKDVKVVFPEKGVYQYVVEASNNKKDWRIVADLRQNQLNETIKMIHTDSLVGVRWIRISFTNSLQAKLSEVEITGIITNN